MKLSTRSRVVKSHTVEVSVPRLVECQNEEFQLLGGHLAVVRNVDESDAGVVRFGNWVEPLGSGSEAKSGNTSEINLELNPGRNLEVKASELLIEAKKHAQEILAQAEVEAEQLRASAQAEATELLQKLREEVTSLAYTEGYEKGFDQGLIEGRTQAEHEAEGKRKEAKALVDLAERAVQEEFSKVDQELLHLVIKIAERVLRANLKISPELLLHQVRALTLFPQEREGTSLHVSPEDFTWLMASDTKDQIQVTLVSDDTLHPGDSFIECSEGIFDARLDAQLARLEHLLREELRHAGLEQAGR